MDSEDELLLRGGAGGPVDSDSDAPEEHAAAGRGSSSSRFDHEDSPPGSKAVKPKRKRGKAGGKKLPASMFAAPASSALPLPASVLSGLEFKSAEASKGKRRRSAESDSDSSDSEAGHASPALAAKGKKHMRFTGDEDTAMSRGSMTAGQASRAPPAAVDAAEASADAAALAALRFKQRHFFGGRLARVPVRGSGKSLAAGPSASASASSAKRPGRR